MKDNKKYNLKTLMVIFAISVFFLFGLVSNPLACSHIQVNTNLEEATFTLYGPKNFSGSGTSWHKVASDGGYETMTYEIVYGYVDGYITPPSETKYLPQPNGLITFNGVYVYQPEDGTSVNITSGDIDGDGIDEIITGAGPRPNAGDEIKVIDENGACISEFRADTYDKYGANVASGDLDGDGTAEIITGAGPGPQNEAFVKIFDVGGVEKTSFTSLDTKYGVNVAIGNLGLEAQDEGEDEVMIYDAQEEDETVGLEAQDEDEDDEGS